MADPLTDTSTVPIPVAPRRWWQRWWQRWWVQVIAVFVASRVVTTVILLWFAAHQRENPWTGPSPGYFEFANLWDAHWYFIIASVGYPAELPLDADGNPTESQWAFMPVYPLVVRALSVITTVPWEVMSVLVSVACAAGTALVFHRLVSMWLTPTQAMWSVALFCCNPLSPILQVSYAESMHLLMLTTALLLLVWREYWALLPVVTLMALTRPSGLAFALALGIHCIHRIVTRKDDPWRRGEAVALFAAGVWSVLCGFAWAGIAALVTGDLTAYTDTELAWRADYIGTQDALLPFAPWFQAGEWWATYVGWPGWVGVVAVGVIVLLAILALSSRAMSHLGVDIRIWVASYLLYLFAVFFPQSSTWRMLLPAYPALAALTVGPRWLPAVAVAASVVGQWFWVDGMWAVSDHDWTPP